MGRQSSDGTRTIQTAVPRIDRGRFSGKAAVVTVLQRGGQAEFTITLESSTYIATSASLISGTKRGKIKDGERTLLAIKGVDGKRLMLRDSKRSPEIIKARCQASFSQFFDLSAILSVGSERPTPSVSPGGR